MSTALDNENKRMPAHIADTSEVVATATAGGWTPEQQLANMLDLCEAQMESALHESDAAVDALIKAFTTLVETTRSLGADGGASAGIEQKLGAMAQQMNSAVVAFQFYDKLSQRLDHVRYSLSTLAMFVCDRTQSREQDQWKRLLTTMRRLYRTEDERRVFQEMTAMMAIDLLHDEAAGAVTAKSPSASAASSIELF